MNPLRYLNSVLTVLAILLALQLWTTWSGVVTEESLSMATPAYAQGIANAGQQRQQMVEELRKVSREVQRLSSLFESGRARVRIDGGTREK